MGSGSPFKGGTADFTSKAVTPHAQTDSSNIYFSWNRFYRHVANSQIAFH